MPLKALLDNRELIAPFLTDEDWGDVAIALRAGARLTLPCCGAAGGIRRSRRGRRFFYHRAIRQVPRCAWAGETVAHLVAKAAIALACRRAGYAVTTEARGPEGRWIADVLAAPPVGGRPLAFEVQWSDQSLDATLARQAAYAADGVRGCWFFRRPPAMDCPRADLPLFGLALDAEDRPVVSSPFILAPHAGAADSAPAWPLDTFVAALLTRRIRFCPAVIATARPAGRVVFFRHRCWRCGGAALLWYVEGRAVRARSGCGFLLVRWPPRHRPVAAELAEALAPATLAVVAAFVAGNGCGLSVAGAAPGGVSGQRRAPRYVCPRCDATIGAAALARDDAFRRARRRFGRRAEPGQPPDPPPGTCPLPPEPRFALREDRPHWCFPAGESWCCDRATDALGVPDGPNGEEIADPPGGE